MKKIILFISILVAIFGNSYAQGNFSINGYLKTDNRMLTDDNSFTWNENQLGLKFEGSYSDDYHLFSEVRLRGFGFPEIPQTADLQRKDKVYKWDLEFREAYLDLYQFGLKDLDLRIGRQIITWGTADKLNPTSNICPDNLEDVFNFGEQLGVNSALAIYYWKDFTFTGVYVPVFTPAILPSGVFASALSEPMELPAGMTLLNISDTVILPENRFTKTSQAAFKVGTNLLDYDLSFSYYYGRDDLPLMNKITITPVDTLGTVNITTEMIYPRMQIIGGDFAGSIGDIGVWGESALTIPDEYGMETIVGGEIQKSIALDDEPYCKFVIGGDYTFKNGLYLNAQYLHGFVHERGKDDLNDYLTFRFEKKFFNDELKVAPIGGAISVTDWDDCQNNYGFVANPEITYYPSDNVEIITGAYILDGKGSNMFTNVKNNDEVYIKVKVSF
ncbi:MAG: hypothetical protein KAW92_05375 [Candidatus Cloacimonetes bacterium]|nr:hypothetical protein [Candidatus Cloacimonadota bacterium]MCK4358165.1 hypothetical protein [Candidatus Cloacimonadota bacterium]